MANAAEFDDMNATPLAKLPMPAVQSKTDTPRVDMGTSYTDILKEMANSREAQQREQPARPEQFRPEPLRPEQFRPEPARDEGGPDGFAPIAPQHAPREIVYVPQQVQQPVYPAARYKRPRGGGTWAKVREYRTSLLVAAIVFVLLWYIAPKLATAAPQLLTPTGRFNMAGLGIIAAMAGGIHRVADKYAP